MFHDINFGGGMPDPKPKFLEDLIKKVCENDNAIGLANDGDADRFGIINEKVSLFLQMKLLRFFYVI